MPNLRHIPIGLAILASVSLSAGVSVWYGYRTGTVALVVTPRQFLPVMPGCSTGFTAIAWFGDGSQTNVTESASWQCNPTVGTMTGSTLAATNAATAFGWIEGRFAGLTNRVHVKVTEDRFWSSSADWDGDGVPDWDEMASNTPPDAVDRLHVRCRVR